MVGVEQWAEIRRLHFVRGLSIREIHRRTGLHREHDPPGDRASTSRRSIAARRRARSSIRSRTRSTGCSRTIPQMPGQRIRELIAPLGFDGGKTIVDDYLREVRPLFRGAAGRFSARSIGPGEICQFDLWEPQGRDPGRPRPDPQGLGRRRVPGLLARRRRRADLLQADARPAVRRSPLPVVARGAAADAGLGSPVRAARRRRPTDRGVRRLLRGAAGRLALLRAAATRRPRASSSACRTSSSRASSPGGASPTSSTSSCSSTPGLQSARTPRHAQDAALPARSTGWSRSAR